MQIVVLKFTLGYILSFAFILKLKNNNNNKQIAPFKHILQKHYIIFVSFNLTTTKICYPHKLITNSRIHS